MLKTAKKTSLFTAVFLSLLLLSGATALATSPQCKNDECKILSMKNFANNEFIWTLSYCKNGAMEKAYAERSVITDFDEEIAQNTVTLFTMESISQEKFLELEVDFDNLNESKIAIIYEVEICTSDLF